MAKQSKANKAGKQNKQGKPRPNLINRASRFLREVRNELRKVNWPNRKELMAYTVVVLVTVFIVTTFIGVVDLIFSRIISAIILR